MNNKDIDIIKNMKTIEWLKAELLNSVSGLYTALATGESTSKEGFEDLISSIVLESFLLGKRLGLSYEGIDRALKENIKLNLLEGHKIEKWYGDLNLLLEYIDKNKN